MNDLTEWGVIDQETIGLGVLRVPNNIDEIWTAIQEVREDPPGIEEYHNYLNSVFEPMNEEATKKKLFDPYLRLLSNLNTNVKPGHWNETDVEWTDRVPLKRRDGEEYKPKPKPNHAEGIKDLFIERHVRKSHPSIMVKYSMALPNCMVELKHHQSTFTAHAQSRYCGAIAAQAWHAYDEKMYGPPARESLDVARVGSMEFNGDVMTGNVHWLSKKSHDSKPLKEPKYHMIRVLNHFVFGLSYEDFVLAHKEACNFRDYFFKRRDEVIVELKKKLNERDAQELEEPS